MDRLTSMAVFVKVVEAGSFSSAAAALGISGPMVGKHVRFLEERLGARLLNRTTRRQHLTELGQGYYERCRIVLAEYRAAEALAQEHHSEPHGRLRVTMPVLLGRHCVAPILTGLAGQHPRIELEMSFSDRLGDILEGEHDLAIRTGTLEGDSSEIIARRVASQQMAVYASPSYLEAHGAPERIDDIARHDAIIYSRTGRVRPWLFPGGEEAAVEIVPAGRLRLDDLRAIADCAARGMGLAWLPSWLVREDVGSGRLVQVLGQQPPYRYDVHVLWQRTPHVPAKVRLSIDALVAQLPGMME